MRHRLAALQIKIRAIRLPPAECRLPIATRPRPLAQHAALRRGEGRECAPQQRQCLGERVAFERTQPAVDDLPERIVVDEQRAAILQQPLDPCGRIGGRSGAGERQADAAGGLFRAEYAAIQQDPAGAPGQQAVDAGAGMRVIGKAAQGWPAMPRDARRSEAARPRR